MGKSELVNFGTAFSAAACSLALVASGCAVPDWSLKGKLRSTPETLGGGEGRQPWGVLAFDELGSLTLNGQILSLPFAQEIHRFGVSFIDASALPSAWRPKHAAEGGPMVSAIGRASPLAIAGLRPFDIVRSVQGQTIREIEALTRVLGEFEPGRVVRIEAMTPRGPKVFEAEAVPEVYDLTSTEVFPFFYAKGQTWKRFICPVFSSWRIIQDGKPEGEANSSPWPAYFDTSAWDLIFDLVKYHSSKNLYTGETKRSFVIFWFIKIKG